MLRASQAAVIVASLALAPWMANANCVPAQTSTARLQSLVEAEATARDALVSVRRSAQDWKNLLLRGRDPTQRQMLQARFEAQVRAYEARLESLHSQLMAQQLELDRLQTLRREQSSLFDRYRAALARHGAASLEAAAAADSEVQGADVASFRTLEQMIDALAGRRAAAFRDLQADIERCAG